MKRLVLFVSFTLFMGTFSFAQETDSPDEKVLVFSKTAGFRHSSIPVGIETIREIGAENGFVVDQTEDAAIFNSDSLQNYSTIIFLSTTGNILNENQQRGFQQYIQNGGGLVGIHAATDTEYDWPWYGRLIGAYFDGHPQIQEASIQVLNGVHESTKHLPREWVVTDEWYNFSNLQPHINVLANLDESTYEGGENGEQHPIAWYHEFEGGRVFYTGRGHTDESFSEPAFRQHILGGIMYASGGAE